MSDFDELRSRIESDPGVNADDGHPFVLKSAVGEPVSPSETWAIWTGRPLPAEVADLWAAFSEAKVLADMEYGQWGLHLLDPMASRLRTDQESGDRPHEYGRDDVVIGAFLGDSELLVYSPSETGMRRLLVALPLDPRADWYGAGRSIRMVLEAWLDNRGDKFWEAPGRARAGL